ncbi:MAG: hypothetical protein M3511_02995 [Deinococcota bacterium]|nr:hypothetical protein [Deinococcota bacterium]
MSVVEKLQRAKFIVDVEGNKTAAVVDYALWEELLEVLEDIDDAEEISRLREEGEEAISWEEAKALPDA